MQGASHKLVLGHQLWCFVGQAWSKGAHALQGAARAPARQTVQLVLKDFIPQWLNASFRPLRALFCKGERDDTMAALQEQAMRPQSTMMCQTACQATASQKSVRLIHTQQSARH